ncbi:MAG: zf-HC2 domain-containing protein [Armatimonadota bacterium]|nr:zf-HC2 domain-containing protein [bacterium]
MRCEECEILISACADDELSGTERTEMLAHICQCESCHRLYEDILVLHRNITTALREPMETPDLVSPVTARVIYHSRARFTWAWAAALALFIVFGYVIHKPAPQIKPAPVVVSTRPQPKPVVKHPRVLPSQTMVATPAPKHVTVQPAPKRIALYVRPPKTKHSVRVPKQYDIDSPIAMDTAEVVVEYSDMGLAAGHAADLSAPVPVAGPGQRVITTSETTIVNGKKTERMCYRVVDNDDKETSTQGETNETP